MTDTFRPDPKPKPYRSKKHLFKVRNMPCCVCGEMWAARVPHHESEQGVGTMGGKTGDDRTVPMCLICHRLRHDTGRDTFWKEAGIDPEEVIREVVAK